MAEQEIAVKKYVVKLREVEPHRLGSMIHTDKAMLIEDIAAWEARRNKKIAKAMTV